MVKVMPMKDMRLSPAEVQECYFPTAKDMPMYPSGLTISLCEDELEKLGLDYDELDTDDMVHMHCLAVVVSKHKSETQSGDDSERICLQITHIACEEEDEEDEENEDEKVEDRLYKR